MRPLLKDLASLAYNDILKRRKTAPFIVLLTFVVSFSIARLTVITFEGAEIIIREYHIHHFYFGILLITLSAWIALVSNRPRLMTAASIFLGTGLGFITDEIGLLLTCNSEGLI